jgi:hypothetical protein
MRYEVHYRAGSEEQSQIIEAIDAAEAASAVQTEIGRSVDSFELLSVHPLDEGGPTSLDNNQPGGHVAP